MNVVYIHTHDTGRYLEPYGAPVSSPRLMEFVREATVFHNAHCTAPTCSPSRAGLLTGMCPHTNGMLGLAHRGFGLNDYSNHMVSWFNNNGWETVLSGIQHVAHNREDIGYRRYIGNPEFEMSHSFNFDSENYDLENAKAAAEYISNTGDKPFFLSFGMFNTHRIFPELNGEYNPDYTEVPANIRNTPENREDVARFHRSASIVDRCTGIVLDALRESGQIEHSIILFTTDHGMPFPGMKCTLSDRGTGVAFILHYPENPLAGGSTDALVSHLDFFPTLCELLELPSPPWLQGKSLIPLMEGSSDRIRDEIFTEISFHASYEPVRSIRTDDHKLIVRYDHDLSPVPANTDFSPSKEDLFSGGYFQNHRYPGAALYDLKIDPDEKNNLIDHPGYSEITENLNKRLTRWMENTDDPIVAHSGKIPIPPGGMVNRRDCVNAVEYDFLNSN